MAKISLLPALNDPDGSELVPVVKAGKTMRASVAGLVAGAVAGTVDNLKVDAVAYIGRPGEAVLVDGTPTGIGAIFWHDTVDDAGSVTAVDVFDRAAGTINLAVYRGPRNALVRVALSSFKTTGTRTSRRIALAEPMAVRAGDILAVQPTAGALVVAEVQSGDVGYTYSAPYLPDTIALDAPTTNGQVQVRFIIAYRKQVVTSDTFLAATAAKITAPRAVALSSDVNPRGYVEWKTTGQPTGHLVKWGNYTANLDGKTQRMEFPNFSLAQPYAFIGNSLTDSTDVINRWSQLLAAQYGQLMISVARYSSDWRMVYRVGAKAIVLTLAGALPAAGTVAVSKINGAAIDGNNPAAFLTTGDPNVVSGMAMSGYLTRNGVTRRATVSAPNGASFAYVVTQAPGQTAITFDGPVTFVPDFALSVPGRICLIWLGNNYFYSQVANANGDYTNPQMWIDLKLIVAFLQARGCRVMLIPIIPSANTADGDNWLARGAGTPYTAMESANARTEAMFPGLMARHADGRTLLKFLQDRNDGSPEALDDVAKGFTPRNLRRLPDGSYDLLHMYGDGAGDRAVKDFVDSALQAQALPNAVTQTTDFVITAIGAEGQISDPALVRVSRDPLADVADQAVANTAAVPTVAAAISGASWLSTDALNLTGAASGLAWNATLRQLAKAIKSVTISGSGVSPTDTYYITTFAKNDAMTGDRIIIRRASDNQTVALTDTATVTKAAGELTRRVLTGNAPYGTNIEFILDIAYDEITATGLLINSATVTPLLISKGASDAGKAQAGRTGFRARNIAFDAAGSLGTGTFQGTGTIPAQAAAGADLAALGIARSHQIGSGTTATALYKRDLAPDGILGKYAFAGVFVSSADGRNWPAAGSLSVFFYTAVSGGAFVATTENIGGYVQVTPTVRWYWGRVKLPATGTIATIVYGFGAIASGAACEAGGWTMAISEGRLHPENVNRVDWSGYSTRDSWRDDVTLRLDGAASLANAAPKLRAGERPWFNSYPNPNLDPLEVAPIWNGSTPTLAAPDSPEFVRRGILRVVNVAGGANRIRKEQVLDANSAAKYYFASIYGYSSDGVNWPAPGAYWYNPGGYVGGVVFTNYVQIDANNRLYYASGQLPNRTDLTSIWMGVTASTPGAVVQIGGYSWSTYSTALTIDDIVRDEWYPQYTRRDKIRDFQRKVSSGGASKFSGKTIAFFGDSIMDVYGIPERIGDLFGCTILNFAFAGCRMSPRNTVTPPDVYYNEFSMARISNAIATGNFSAMIAAANYLAANANYDRVAKVALMAATDWSKVNFATISYGTNDYTGATAIAYLLGAPGNTDEYTFNGAINLAVQRLLTKAPQMDISMFTPTWRGPASGLGDSNTGTNANGNKLTDYGDAIVSRGAYWGLPVFDLYKTLGINLYNKGSFLSPDELHPLVPAGRDRWASRMSAGLLSRL